MKKLFAAVCCILMLFSSAACAGGQATAPFDTERPWGTPTNAFEQCSYTLQIFERVRVDGAWADGQELATGGFTQTLNASGAGKDGLASVASELSVSWKDLPECAENRGKTDLMESAVVFSAASMAPVSSQKTMTLDVRADADGASYNHSYDYSADYAALTSHIKFGKNASGDYSDPKTIAIPSGTKYDNEQLFYLLRAHRNLKPGAGVAFNVNNVADNYIRDNNNLAPMTASASSETVKKELGAFMLDYAESAEIECMLVLLSLSGTDSGPAHRFYIAEPGIRFGKGNIKTAKIIVGYEYTLYTSAGTEQFRYVYTLTGYTTKRSA